MTKKRMVQHTDETMGWTDQDAKTESSARLELIQQLDGWLAAQGKTISVGKVQGFLKELYNESLDQEI